MKLIAQIEDEQNEINFVKEESTVLAEINGRKYELEWSNPEPNVYLLRYDGKIFEAFVSPVENKTDPQIVSIKNENFSIRLIDSKKLKTAAGILGMADGIIEIKTAMPGKIVRVLAEKDQAVESGQGVIVVEAMKMQNEMKSPKDGTIKEIRFSEGDTVNSGDVLVIIE
jgi:biotin carboxyl carrier protein